MFREVLEVDAASLQALRGLERVCQALQKWADLVGVLEMQLDVVTTERERLDLALPELQRLGDIADLQPTRFAGLAQLFTDRHFGCSD